MKIFDKIVYVTFALLISVLLTACSTSANYEQRDIIHEAAYELTVNDASNAGVCNANTTLQETYEYAEDKVCENEYEPIEEQAIFITKKRIHPNMPEFTFIRKLGDFVEEELMTTEERYVSITILDEDGDILQKIDGLILGGHGWWVVADFEPFNLQFDDFNFDGYLDIWLLSAINPGTASGAWAYFWIWCPETGQFVKNEQLSYISDMAWLTTNHDTGQIEVFSRGGGAGPWSTIYYEYDSGEFIAVASVLDEWVWRNFVSDYMRTTHRNLVTGETLIEADPPCAAPDYVIHKTIDINPYMEFPAHDVKLSMYRLPEDSPYRAHGYQYEIEIIIEGTRRSDSGVWQTWQTIRGLRAGYGYGRWIDIDPENPLNLHFADFNGNGYMDMALRRLPPQTGGMADDPHYFWIFDPEAQSLWNGFARNYSLENISNRSQVVSAEYGHILAFFFYNVMDQYWAVYTYADGEFVFERYAR